MPASPPVRRRHRTSESVRTWTPRLPIAVGRARPTAARANSNYRQSDDGRPVDALRTAPAQGLTENRQDHGSEVVQSEAGDRLAGNCDDGEQAATRRYCRLAIVVRRLRRRAIIVVLMGAAVRMNVKCTAMFVVGAVVVKADIAPLGTQCAEDIRCFEDRALLVVCNALIVRLCRASELVCGGSVAVMVRSAWHALGIIPC